jgi:hypothetical protein
MIPSPAPVAAPIIKPSVVVLVIDGVLLTNIKPAAAIHKVQRTMRMFMVYSKNGSALPLSPLAAGVQQRRVTFQSGKSPITVPPGQKSVLTSARRDIEVWSENNNAPCRAPDYAGATLTCSPSGDSKHGYLAAPLLRGGGFYRNRVNSGRQRRTQDAVPLTPSADTWKTRVGRGFPGHLIAAWHSPTSQAAGPGTRIPSG